MAVSSSQMASLHGLTCPERANMSLKLLGARTLLNKTWEIQTMMNTPDFTVAQVIPLLQLPMAFGG